MDILRLKNDLICNICKAFCTNLTNDNLKDIDAGTYFNPLYKKVSDRFSAFKNRPDALAFMCYPYPIIFLSMKTASGEWSKPIIYSELDNSILDDCYKDIHDDIKATAMSLVEICLSLIVQSWNIHNIAVGTVPNKKDFYSEESINKFKEVKKLLDNAYIESGKALDTLTSSNEVLDTLTNSNKATE